MTAYHFFEIAVIALAVLGSFAYVFRRWGRVIIAGLRGRSMKAAAASGSGGCASCNDCGSCAPSPPPMQEKPIAILRR